jgi:hypothetical protein
VARIRARVRHDQEVIKIILDRMENEREYLNMARGSIIIILPVLCPSLKH